MGALEQQLYDGLLWAGLLIGGAVFIALFFVTAPYGRHARTSWGPTVHAVPGWVLMELPAATGFAIFFLLGTGTRLSPAWIFLLLWETHYVHRSLVFPFRLRETGKRTPVLIVLLAILFNLWNTYLNGRYLGAETAGYPVSWFLGPRFIAGATLFLSGLTINIQSDSILFRLRQSGGTGYEIPHGGLYRWVSCPNYFSEILEWCGWALATWSLPGLVFALWSMANLVPRARAHHRWYHEQFPAYPPERKAVFPFVY